VKYPKGTTEHPLNKGKKKEILVSVWDFGAVHPQSERSYYVCNDHPAKMRPALARAILQLYGESPVLDPMAGVGTTLVEAMLLGMNAIGVEYEKKFVDQSNKNIRHLQKTYRNKSVGKAVCIQGDARDLSCLKNVNAVFFSPPYFNALKRGDGGPSSSSKRISYEERVKRFQGYSTDSSNIGNIRQFGSIFFSPPYFNAIKSVSTGHQGPEGGHLTRQHKLAKEGKSGYGSGENIGHEESYGSIIFSPPYFDALSLNKGGGSKASIQHEETTQDLQMKRSGPFAVKKNLPTPYSSKQENIGNQKDYGVFGSVVLSPPYFCSVSDVVKSRHRYPVTKQGMSRRQEYSDDASNIGNIAKFGSIIFSPPYMSAIKGSGRKREEAIKAMRKAGITEERIKTFMGELGCIKWQDEGYSLSSNQIGNLNGTTYLSEMLKVYRECYRVLKPGKFMVVVVKDIQRNWKTIPLGADTIKLCQLAGFDCHDVIINKMYFPSFWMLSLAKNSQGEYVKGTQKFHALKSHEYVLVFRKPSDKS